MHGAEWYKEKYETEYRDREHYQRALESANNMILDLREKIEALIEKFKK